MLLLYILNTEQANKRKTNIYRLYKIPEPFKTIFVDFFYNKFFQMIKFEFFDISSFSRSDFTIILKMKTDYLSVHTVTSTQP